MRQRSACAAVAVALLFATSARAQLTTRYQDGVSPQGTYSGTRDVLISSAVEANWDPSLNYASTQLQLDGFEVQKVVLIRWDLGTAVPPGAMVTSVQLHFDVAAGSTETYQVYECLRPWAEDQVTWFDASSGVPWSTPGAQAPDADRGTTVLGTFAAANPGAAFITLNGAGIAAVSRWLAGTSPNHGFLIQNFNANDGIDFRASESGTATLRPRLVIDYVGGTAEFQQAVLPSAAYSGTTDAIIVNGPPPGMANFDRFGLDVRGDVATIQSLVRFELEGLPRGVRIDAAELGFAVNRAGTGTYSVYELLAPWTETGASQLTYDGAASWEVAGAAGASDRGSAVLASAQNPPVGALTFALNAQGLATVQAWARGERPNHGVLIAPSPGATWLGMFNRSAGTPANRPSLRLTYSLVAAPQIVSAGSEAATCGEPYAYSAQGRVEAVGEGPLSYGARTPGGPAPAGFSVDASTGAVSWTPGFGTAGPVAVELVASSFAGEDVQPLTIQVACGPEQLRVGCGCGASSAEGTAAALLTLLGALGWRRR